ncbi:murein hydrolase activator EnvC [Leadbetterella sp. DM7]|uniref:murein hydrolase activator EnvC family protein n=1 Tax=Leadbetterella sp. DM7 TaxID=3235085 RepID=UPI00349E708F
MMRLTFIILLVAVSSVFGQTQKSRAALEAEKKENLERIEQVKKILGQTQKEKRTSLSQAQALRRQIDNQEKKISLAQQDYDLIQREMAENLATQDTLRLELGTLQKEYAEIIVREAKNSRKLTRLGFLFSSTSLTELFMRYKYLQQYSENRKGKFEKIKNLAEALKKRQAELAQGKVRQANVIQQVSEDKKGLDDLKQKQDQIVKELTSKEGQLKTELKKQQDALRRLNSVISVAIAREIAARKAEEEAKAREAARKKAEETARLEAERREAERRKAELAKSSGKTVEEAPPPKTEAAPKREEAPVREPAAAPTRAEVATVATGKFSAAKNKLSWPANGFISSQFGVRDHAVLKGIKVDNHGVDIRTAPGAEVRSVFEGVVLDISEIPGLNYVVAVQHGDYYTVYANLASVAVRVNQKVSGREIIGTVAEKDGVPEINFQVWHNFTKLNPELWLGSK